MFACNRDENLHYACQTLANVPGHARIMNEYVILYYGYLPVYKRYVYLICYQNVHCLIQNM